MAELDLDSAVQAWYRSTDATAPNIAKEAYEDALESWRQEFHDKPEALSWIESCKSIETIRTEAGDVEARYRAAGANKNSILHCMRKVSSWIMFYGQVLDMMSQHHPEYVSLAWGATKFILMGVLNHEKLSSQLSQGLADIANLLPRSEFHAKLYPTERMKASMAQLYACLLLFLREAVKWFSRSSTGRVVSAVFEPFELKRKDLIDRIRTCAGVIDEEAAAASKAELRGLHVHVEQNGKSISVLGARMEEAHTLHQARLNAMDTKLQNICVELKDIRGTVGDTRDRVVNLQYHELLRKLRPKTLPEDSLRKSLSLSSGTRPGYTAARIQQN